MYNVWIEQSSSLRSDSFLYPVMFSNNSFCPSFPGMNTPNYIECGIRCKTEDIHAYYSGLPSVVQSNMKRMYGSTYTFVISDHDIAWGLGLLTLYSLFNNRFGRACFRVVYELLLVYVLANIMHEFAKLYMQTQP